MKRESFFKSCRKISTLAICLSAALVLASCSRGPDLSTPTKAAAAFAKAVKDGDMDTVRKAATGTEQQFATIKSLCDMQQAMNRYEAASVKKFGNDGKLPPEMKKNTFPTYENADEKITGDKATVTDKSRTDESGAPIDLKKDGDKWKVSLDFMGKGDADGADKMFPAMIKSLDTVTKNIDDGKYKTAAEANAAMVTEMMK